MDSPSVNSPSKYLEGLIGDREATTPHTGACVPAIVTLLGDDGSGCCVFACFGLVTQNQVYVLPCCHLQKGLRYSYEKVCLYF